MIRWYIYILLFITCHSLYTHISYYLLFKKNPISHCFGFWPHFAGSHIGNNSSMENNIIVFKCARIKKIAHSWFLHTILTLITLIMKTWLMLISISIYTVNIDFLLLIFWSYFRLTIPHDYIINPIMRTTTTYSCCRLVNRFWLILSR